MYIYMYRTHVLNPCTNAHTCGVACSPCHRHQKDDCPAQQKGLSSYIEHASSGGIALVAGSGDECPGL